MTIFFSDQFIKLEATAKACFPWKLNNSLWNKYISDDTKP